VESRPVELDADVEAESARLGLILTEVGRVVVGQQALLRRLLIGLLTRGHVLLEGLPGLAKTTAVKALAGAIDCTFRRIQFTPDLLPADIVGTLIFNPRDGTFSPRKGPVFAHLLLADEINRAPAKVQSALLECMQEGQVTIGDATWPLPEPFQVLATQNPIEHEGTYPLPEAQVDRFMLKVRVDYPSRSEEELILDRHATAEPQTPRPVASAADIVRARRLVEGVYMDARVRGYILDLVAATRRPAEAGLSVGPLIRYGASPRASLFLARAGRAHAFLEGRSFVLPEDIKAIGFDVLRHRLLLTYEAEAENIDAEEILRRVFDAIPVP